jgi:hypothetical protein
MHRLARDPAKPIMDVRPGGQLSAGGNGAVSEPDVRACLVGSWDRVGELGHGQVTVQGLKAVMIHGRN